jgi:hypothetical protein
VKPDFRFGIEIDSDQIEADAYQAIHGDVRHAVPLLRLLGTKFPSVACNPPFGLDWKINGRTENSTIATWTMAISLLAEHDVGAFIAGRDRFLRDIVDRPDAAGVYALVECKDLFDGVGLPCLIAFFVHPHQAERMRARVSARSEGRAGPLRISAARSELADLEEEIIAERERRGTYILTSWRCPHRDSLVERFAGVRSELVRRREKAAVARQQFDLALRGGRISSRPSPFARLALGQRDFLRNVERLHNQPSAYFALNLREWRQLCALRDEDILTIDPAFCEGAVSAS